MQPHEKVAVLNPVASRPLSSLRSFPKVLQDFNVTGSPTIIIWEELDLIRPKATRFASLLGDLPTQIAATIHAKLPRGMVRVAVYHLMGTTGGNMGKRK
ncbi:unnamed protein product [Miscanthus lutarioriparius]|uniref:Uncharacterized protein n=1 Tax=Miscanthus lutarioriparius TaxID=422564 RepID=A0A811RMF2_9POAL|nr:unnamed protein product [Miscanthus lutarioriparius]